MLWTICPDFYFLLAAGFRRYIFHFPLSVLIQFLCDPLHLQYPFIPFRLFFYHECLFFLLQSTSDTQRTVIWRWRRLVHTYISVWENGEKGIYPALCPLPGKLQEGLSPYWPSRKLHFSFTWRLQAPIDRSFSFTGQEVNYSLGKMTCFILPYFNQSGTAADHLLVTKERQEALKQGCNPIISLPWHGHPGVPLLCKTAETLWTRTPSTYSIWRKSRVVKGGPSEQVKRCSIS